MLIKSKAIHRLNSRINEGKPITIRQFVVRWWQPSSSPGCGDRAARLRLGHRAGAELCRGSERLPLDTTAWREPQKERPLLTVFLQCRGRSYCTVIVQPPKTDCSKVLTWKREIH